MAARTHTYQSHLLWEGSTGAGYREYGRAHRVALPPSATELELSSDPAFRGYAGLPNPEQLLLAAASSCQLLSFLAVAALRGIDVISYEDDASAEMPESVKPLRITAITLTPHIVVGADADTDVVGQLMQQAHEECYVANTLNAVTTVRCTVERDSTSA